MTEQRSIVKELSTSPSYRLVRALVENQKSKGYNATTFHETEIERVMEIGEKRSALVLRSGTEIPVALPYEKLEQQIYFSSFRTDDTVLDLRDVTGEVAQVHEPGDKMPDGTVYAGISPDTGRAIYTTPVDAHLTYTFNQAKEYAQGLQEPALKANDHDDWRVPTKAELNVMFNNRAAIGRFDETSNGRYWSSSEDTGGGAWCQRFRDGYREYRNEEGHSSLRCVR